MILSNKFFDVKPKSITILFKNLNSGFSLITEDKDISGKNQGTSGVEQ